MRGTLREPLVDNRAGTNPGLQDVAHLIERLGVADVGAQHR
jgi:hypothetical protein